MELSENEYTIKSFIHYLEKKYGSKISGKPFNASDICQYQMRGYLPYRYGGQKIVCTDKFGVKIITLFDEVNLIKNKIKK
jgi:hypothetical protein